MSTNKLTLLLDERDQIKIALEKLDPTKKTNAPKISNFRVRLKQVLDRLNHFGTKQPIIMVNITYPNDGDEETKSLYFTDITEEEAIDYVKLKSPITLTFITAFTIPSGKPVKLIIKEG